MDRLTGKVAIVTGAARGIGEGIARKFIEEGALVALVDNNEEGLAALVQDLGSASKVLALTGDISIQADVERFIAATVDHFSGIDVVVNNAAIKSFGRTIDADDMLAR